MKTRKAIMSFEAGEVEVGFETSVGVNQVEMSALLARHFGLDNFRRRQVELRNRKRLRQTVDILTPQEHHEINIMGQAWLAVEDGGHAPADHVPHLEPIQWPDEQQREFRFRHS